MPPAFVLSQDQTLKLACRFSPCGIDRQSPGIVRLSSVGIDIPSDAHSNDTDLAPPPAHPFLFSTMSKTGCTHENKKVAEPATGSTPMTRRFCLSRQNRPQQNRCVRHYLVRGDRPVGRPGAWYRPARRPLSSLSVAFLPGIQPIHRAPDGAESWNCDRVRLTYCSINVLDYG
jgi:hypothetical protein